MISTVTSTKLQPDSAIADSPYDLTCSENVNFFRLILKLIRMKQWIKNGFVFVPLLFLFAIPSVSQVLSCAVGAFLFCLVSSAVYIMNDIVDVSKDRAHPVKRNRPIASGAVPLGFARILCWILLIAGVAGAAFLNPGLALIILGYFIMNIAYSFLLKKIMFVDVFTISMGFILRLCAGFKVLRKPISDPCTMWFIFFVAFLTLFIGVGKRCNELKTMGGNSGEFRESLKGCSTSQLDQLIVMLMACTIMSYAIFVYTTMIKYLVLTMPLLLLGVFRYHYLNNGSELTGSPEMIIYKDRPIRCCLVFWALILIAICFVQTYFV
nr:UbiA prenyltransferase family protein [Butyrivibrio sp.]